MGGRRLNDAASFGPEDPPPRADPRGLPIARYVVLPTLDPVEEVFRQWDREGRVPEGSVLCEFVGTETEPTRRTSGHRCAVGPWEPGTFVSLEALAAYAVRAAVRVKGRTGCWTVFAPAAGPPAVR